MKKSKKQLNEENDQIQGAFIHELQGMHARFVDWLNRNKRIDTLTRNEAEFLNALALAIQLYKDGEAEKDNNGKLGQ